jgi:secreted PhoX family phosphatase
MKKQRKDPTTSTTEKSQVSRRNFVKGAATLAAAAATVPLKPLLAAPGRQQMPRPFRINPTSVRMTASFIADA